MKYGILGGVFWALDTVLLSIALAMTPFMSTTQAVFFAPFVSTFMHDTFSAIWLSIYMIVTKQVNHVIEAVKTRGGRFVMLGALLGGPVGMTSYLLAIKYLGPSYTAAISATYPAFGAFLSYFVLKERLQPYQIVGLGISIVGVILIGYTPAGGEQVSMLGLLFALLTVFSWGSEAVICSYGMTDGEIPSHYALQIRQMVSGCVYAVILLPILKAWPFTISILPELSTVVILVTALAGTLSYACYYKAIKLILPSKAMALNITYSAWAIVFSLVLLGVVPSIKSILCALMILCGSIMAAYKKDEDVTSVETNTSMEMNVNA